MYKRLYEYISVECPVYKFQFGFRKYHFIALALITVTDEIYQQLDNGNIIMGIYCDLQKAFVTVSHGIILSKIYNYGIRGTVFNWFKNYLTFFLIENSMLLLIMYHLLFLILTVVYP